MSFLSTAKRRAYSSLSVIISIGLCCGPFINRSAGQASQLRRETILIIGVQHAPGEFRGEKYSPAHIRATLEAFNVEIVEQLLKSNDARVNRCEAEIMAASLYYNLKQSAESKQHLAASEGLCQGLQADSWWFKERQRIRSGSS